MCKLRGGEGDRHIDRNSDGDEQKCNQDSQKDRDEIKKVRDLVIKDRDKIKMESKCGNTTEMKRK